MTLHPEERRIVAWARRPITLSRWGLALVLAIAFAAGAVVL